MPPEAIKYLFDIQQAIELLQQFAQGKNLEVYHRDLLLRSATERQLEIIGEALNKLARTDLAVAHRIADYQRIIAFRNVLIHGYDSISSSIVWDVIETKIPTLQLEVATLIQELSANS